MKSYPLLILTVLAVVSALTCPPGRYFNLVECTECAPGSVTDTFDKPGASLCQPCSSGQYSGDPQVPCAICRAGKYSGGGSSGCQECAPGKFGTEEGRRDESDACSFCPPGSYTDTLEQASATTCIICATGLYSPISTFACETCSVGSITDTLGGAGATTCEMCPPGQFSTSPTIPCIGCPVGKYQAPDVDNGCLDCPPGSVTDTLNDQGASTCRECAPGRFSSKSNIPCRPCTAGFYSGLASSKCTGCAPGKFGRVASSEDETNCLVCPKGSVTDRLLDPGSTSCTACKKGKFSANSYDACKLCGVGRFCEVNACPYCVGCKLGFYHSMLGSSTEQDCIECNPGSVTDTLNVEGGSSCTACTKGKYSDAPFNKCTGCPPGRYGTIEAARIVRDCITCPAGSVTDTLGQPGGSSCTSCGAGRFSNSAGAACTNCPKGQYSTGEEASTECEQCLPGKYGQIVASTTSDHCRTCPYGHITNKLHLPGASTCSACAVGTYSPKPTTSCIPCVAGAVTNSPNTTGANECFSCEAGRYSRAQDDSCIVCAVGKYADGRASVNCKECTSGAVTNTLTAQGASQCTRCTVGKYSTAPTRPCVDCAPGQFVARTGSDGKDDCLQCAKGQYQPASGGMSCIKCGIGKLGTGADPVNEHVQCQNCTAGRFQQKTGKIACTMCEVGKYQPTKGSSACRTCDREHLISDYYIKQAGVCKLCPDTISFMIVLPVAALLLLVRGAHAMVDKQYATNASAQTLVAVITLLVSAAQVMVLVAEYVYWPEMLGQFFNIISLFNLKMDSLPADCLGVSRPNLVLATVYGIPCGFAIANLGAFLFLMGSKRVPWEPAFEKCKAAFTLLMVWFYLTTLSTSYGWMTCNPKADDFVSVYDESIRCFDSSDSKWTTMFGGSVPALMFYQLFWPYYIYKNYEDLLFITSPFRRGWQQRWLKYELAYRVCLVLLRALLHEWAHLQGVFMMVCVLAYHYALWYHLPYSYKVVTKFNGILPYFFTMSFSMQVLAIFVGFLYNAKTEMSPGLDIFFIFLFMCWSFAASWYCYKQYTSAAIKVNALDKERVRQLNEVDWDPAFTMATNIKVFKFLIAVFLVVAILSLRSGSTDGSGMHLAFGMMCLIAIVYIWYKQINVLNAMQRVFDPNCYPDLGERAKTGFTVSSLKAALAEASQPEQDEVRPVSPIEAGPEDAKEGTSEKTPGPALPTLNLSTIMGTPGKAEGLFTPRLATRDDFTHTPEYRQEANARILREYYAKHNPSKVQDVDLILEEYTVAELVSTLHEKYNDVPALEGLGD